MFYRLLLRGASGPQTGGQTRSWAPLLLSRAHCFLPPSLGGEKAGIPEASNTSSAVLTLEESLFDLLFIKVCILNALLGPKCWEGR